MTPTEERELLELAAKARGYTIKFHPAVSYSWNSLLNNGDCLDLAAHLILDIVYDKVWITDKKRVKVIFYPDYVVESFEDESERLAATRLAVTRAAAEIGRRMKG